MIIAFALNGVYKPGWEIVYDSVLLPFCAFLCIVSLSNARCYMDSLFAYTTRERAHSSFGDRIRGKYLVYTMIIKHDFANTVQEYPRVKAILNGCSVLDDDI